jgi:hypothetical protein
MQFHVHSIYSNIYIFEYSNFSIFRLRMRIQNALNTIVASIICFQYTLHFVMNQIWICYCHPKNIPIWPHADILTQSIKEVEVFRNTKKIDILLVSETHFKEKTM